jgi:hypothetical protein|tara:strand:- start:2177 stop:2341 length:165 start_codon:yes stop_codon:yes gene_type:complete
LQLEEIKEKLEEALETSNWDIIMEIISDIEIEENYMSPFTNGGDDDDDEENWLE